MVIIILQLHYPKKYPAQKSSSHPPKNTFKTQDSAHPRCHRHFVGGSTVKPETRPALEIEVEHIVQPRGAVVATEDVHEITVPRSFTQSMVYLLGRSSQDL